MIVVVAKGQSGNAENIIRIKYTNEAYTQAQTHTQAHMHRQRVGQTAVTSTQLTFQLFLQMAQRKLADIKHTHIYLHKQTHAITYIHIYINSQVY